MVSVDKSMHVVILKPKFQIFLFLDNSTKPQDISAINSENQVSQEKEKQPQWTDAIYGDKQAFRNNKW